MTENEILKELAEILIWSVKNETENVSAGAIVKMAHLNGGILNPDKTFRCQARTCLRFVMNEASAMCKENFMAMGKVFTEKIWDYANDTDILDSINNNHNLKQRNQ